VPVVNVRWAWLIPGLLLCLLGTLWALQGAGLVGGSAMSGRTLWVWIGGLVALIGLLLASRGLAGGRRRA
jgi:hypothetical protein